MQEYSFKGSDYPSTSSPNNGYSATKLEKHIALSASRHHENNAYLESIFVIRQNSSSAIQTELIALLIPPTNN